MHNTAFARIDLGALRHNLAVVRTLCPHSRIMATVKADAYGHGLIQVARTLEAADGFAVARLHEAILLRDAGITQQILLLGTLLDESDLAYCAERRIDVTAHSDSIVQSIVHQARRTPLRVWLKLDSGMHRLGLSPEEFLRADSALSKHPGILELIHMTHFSSAEDACATVMDAQISSFQRCHQANPRAKASLANSAALLSRSETHADWVRPGIMLYGTNPLGPNHSTSLRAVMSLRARVLAIRRIRSGESVGYNGCWTSARNSRIGTIGIGYGDGYPRHTRNGTPVWIAGHVVPLVGRVSMDSLAVDLTDFEHVAVGAEATLWGPELSAAIVADHANTIAYQLFTAVTSRVQREYIT